MATKGFLERPGTYERVKRLILDGKTNKQIADEISTRRDTITPHSISAFKARHADDLRAGRAKLDEAAIGLAIANRRHQLEDLDAAEKQIMAKIADGELFKVRHHMRFGEELIEVIDDRPNLALLRMLDMVLNRTQELLGQKQRWSRPEEGAGYSKDQAGKIIEGELAAGPPIYQIVRNVPSLRQSEGLDYDDVGRNVGR